MLPNSGILVFVSSGIPLPSSSELHPFHGTSGVTTSLCLHPLRHCVPSAPWFLVHALSAATCFLAQPPGLSLLAPSQCHILVSAAWERPFSYLSSMLSYFEIPWNCWIFYHRHYFLTSKKKKCHVVNVPLLSTKGSVQSKPFTVVQNVLKKQLFFGVLGCKKAITYALFLQE